MTSTDLELATRLQQFEAAADAVLEAGMRPNTRHAFAQDWVHWTRFCAAAAVPVETVDASLLLGFVGWLAKGGPDHAPQAPETIRRRLTGVLAGWKDRKLTVPHGITSKARKALDILIRQLAEANETRGRGASPALTMPQLRKICAAIPDDVRGHRDRFLLTVGFGFAARRGELANLLVADLTIDARGLVVRVREGKSPREVAIPPGQHPATDPVLAWQRWRDVAALVEGPALRRVHHRSGKPLPGGLSDESVGAVVTARAEAVGIYGLTGHSLRSGLATSSRQAGHDPKTIAAQTGHSERSEILWHYMQIVDRWADNALTGVGM